MRRTTYAAIASVIAVIVAVSSIVGYFGQTLHSTRYTYTTYTISMDSGQCGQIIREMHRLRQDVKAQLLIYRNGKLIINKTDPPTWNFWQFLRAALGLGFYNGTIAYMYIRGLDGNYYKLPRSGVHYIVTRNPYVLLGNGSQTPDIYVYKLASPIGKRDDIHQRRIEGNRVYLLATFLFNNTYYISEVGWVVNVGYLDPYGNWHKVADALMLYDAFSGFWVHPGDNVTIVWILDFPTSKLAKWIGNWLNGATSVHLPQYYVSHLTVKVVNNNVTSTFRIPCIHTLYLHPEVKIVEVCSGFAGSTGNITAFWTTAVDRYGNVQTSIDGAINVTLSKPYYIEQGEPIAVVLEISMR